MREVHNLTLRSLFSKSLYQIIHHDSKGIMKLKTQIDFAHRELAETGEQLANSNALAKVYCLKADAMESEYSQLKSTMVKVMKHPMKLRGGTESRAGRIYPHWK